MTARKRTFHAVSCMSRVVVIAVATVCAASSGSRAADRGSYEDSKKQQCGAIEEEFQDVMKKLSKEAVRRTISERLERIDELAARLDKMLGAMESASLEGILGNVVGEAGPPQPKGETTLYVAIDLLEDFKPDLTEPIRLQEMLKEDAEIVQRYCDARMRAAESHVRNRAELVYAAGDEGNSGLAELSVLLTFLRIPDAQWSSQDAAMLPQWLKERDKIEKIEQFAISDLRARTAYECFRYARGDDKEPATDTWQKRSGYLQAVGENRITRDNVHIGVRFLKAAAELAGSHGDPGGEAKVRYRLSQVYDQFGHKDLAAQECKTILDKYPEYEERPKIVMRRLVLLAGAGEYETIRQEATAYADEPALKTFRPNVLYVLWVAHRKREDTVAAEALYRRFVEEYPRCDLCADMMFAAAMEALAKGDYEQASRFLETIEYRYPKSKMVQRARSIRSRLEGAPSPEQGTQ